MTEIDSFFCSGPINFCLRLCLNSIVKTGLHVFTIKKTHHTEVLPIHRYCIVKCVPSFSFSGSTHSQLSVFCRITVAVCRRKPIIFIRYCNLIPHSWSKVTGMIVIINMSWMVCLFSPCAHGKVLSFCRSKTGSLQIPLMY